MAFVGLTRFGRTENEDDKDDAADAEIDSGIQSEKGKAIDEDRYHVIENFARNSAQELIEKTARDFAEARASLKTGSSPEVEGEDSEDGNESSDRKSSNGDCEPRAVETIQGSASGEETVDEDNVEAERESVNRLKTGDSRTEEPVLGEGNENIDANEEPEEDISDTVGQNSNTVENDPEDDTIVEEGTEAVQKSMGNDTSDGDEPDEVDDTEHVADGASRDGLDQECDTVTEENEDKEHYSEVKEFIRGALPESESNSVEHEFEPSRPPLTPQNSFAGETESAENFERSLSAIPEAVSPGANLELRDDDEANDDAPAEELDNSKNSDPTGSEAETDEIHQGASKTSGDDSEKSDHSDEGHARSDESTKQPVTAGKDGEVNGISEDVGSQGSETRQDVPGDDDSGEVGPMHKGALSGPAGEEAPEEPGTVESKSELEETETNEGNPPDESANEKDHDAKQQDAEVEDEIVAENGDKHDPKTNETLENDEKATTGETDVKPADIPNAQEEALPEDDSKVQNGELENHPGMGSDAPGHAAVGDDAEVEKKEIAKPAPGESTADESADTIGDNGGAEAPQANAIDVQENANAKGEAGDVENKTEVNGVGAGHTEGSNGNDEVADEQISGNRGPSGEDPESRTATGEETTLEPLESAPDSEKPDQPELPDPTAGNDHSQGAGAATNGNNPEPYLGPEQGARAASEAFIENAALEAAKTPHEEKATRARSKSKKRKQAARMKAAMDRLNELIDYWIKEEDLLRLEHVVIAGQGDRLVGKTSPNPQVQEFLSLVPTYMEKIRQVHQAVIKGDVKEVKELLTRKRFALSRDVNGASPLHLSILYGHPEVLKYIVEFFPETLDGPDNEGRTPLHYAAVAPVIDVNFYQLLKQAGADINIKDKNGNSADFYRTHPGVLTIEDIFRNYQNSPDEEIAAIETVKEPSSPRKTPNQNMTDVKQEVRETVTNMIRELNMEERGYVEGSGVEAVLVDALIVVCAKRPSTPVSFLGDYLLSVSQATPRDVPTAGANDSSVKTESFKAEVTKVETKSTAIPVSESESEVSKPKSATAPVNDQDSKNVKTTSTLGREASPVSPRKKTDAPPITVPDAMKVQKMEVVPPKAVATDISSKPSEPKRPETEKAPQPEQVSPVVAVVPVSAKMQPPAMPSPTKLAPVPEAAKPVHQPPPQAISTGPPLVAPMQPLGTAPMMSVTSQSSVPGGILKQSKPATIVYKDDLFEDDER